MPRPIPRYLRGSPFRQLFRQLFLQSFSIVLLLSVLLAPMTHLHRDFFTCHRKAATLASDSHTQPRQTCVAGEAFSARVLTRIFGALLSTSGALCLSSGMYWQEHKRKSANSVIAPPSATVTHSRRHHAYHIVAQGTPKHAAPVVHLVGRWHSGGKATGYCWRGEDGPIGMRSTGLAAIGAAAAWPMKMRVKKKTHSSIRPQSMHRQLRPTTTQVSAARIRGHSSHLVRSCW